MYSSPPIHGAAIVATILKTPELDALWRSELKAISARITDMRALLLGHLQRIETPGDWTHITSQIGMFSFTGLSKPQSENMIN